MKKLTIVSLIVVLSLTVGAVALASEGAHWSYEGDTGPEHWGDLSHDYAACSEGTEQSPVDIPAGAPVNPAAIAFDYQPTALNIVNNGHTIQVNYDAGSSITVEGQTYDLLQFHFHRLSEHTVAGQHYDLEMHLVHQSADGQYAVVGVLLTAGAENAAYAPVWAHLPAEEGEAETIEGVSVAAADLLPADPAYYRYDGSFTTPPCTEGVKWFVLSNPVELSAGQIAAFEAIYNGNYRPVQPLNARSFLRVGAEPETMPVTGGPVLPVAGLLLGFGALTTAAGVYHFLQQGSGKVPLLHKAVGVLTRHPQVGHQVVLLQVQVVERTFLQSLAVATAEVGQRATLEGETQCPTDLLKLISLARARLRCCGAVVVNLHKECRVPG